MDALKLISKGSGKMKGVLSINTSPLTNSFCQKMNACGDENTVCTQCYSVIALRTYRKNASSNYAMKSEILSTSVLEKHLLPQNINTLFLRFNSHGELINDIHMTNLMNIAKINPDTIFALWTKRLDIINPWFEKNGKPDNVIIIYSNPKIDNPIMNLDKVSKWIDKIFNVVYAEYAIGNKIDINCSNKCNECRICYTKDSTNIINEVVKQRGRIVKKAV